jgi:hypothetical protein
VPASAVISQPTPPRSSGMLTAATTAATSSTAAVAGAAGRTGPGQRLPKADTAGQGPCSGGVTGCGCGVADGLAGG